MYILREDCYDSPQHLGGVDISWNLLEHQRFLQSSFMDICSHNPPNTTFDCSPKGKKGCHLPFCNVPTLLFIITFRV